MNTYSCIRYYFEKLAALRGYRCNLYREHLPYLHGNAYRVTIDDPFTRTRVRYSFCDEDLQAVGWRISAFAEMVIDGLINEIRKKNEKENEKMKLIDCVNWRADGVSISQNDPCSVSRIQKERITNAVIKNVIFNPPATIVFWTDGTKTVVKTQNGEEFDPEKGLTMAYFKKMHGNKGHYFEEIKKWTEKYEDQNTVKYTDEELEVAYSEFEKNLMKLNATVLNYLAAKYDSTPGDDQCQST